VLITASQIGGVAAPTLAALLIEFVGWRRAFAVFGAVGVVWAVGFYWWFRDDPADHAAVGQAELAHIGKSRVAAGHAHAPIPWGAVFASPSIWILGTIMTCAAFNSYFYYSWFPTYLKEGRQVAELEAGRLNSLVLGGAAIGTFCGGFAVDRLLRGKKSDLPRKAYGGIAYLLAFVFLWLAVQSGSPQMMASLAALSTLCMSCTLPMWWSCAIGVSGRHVGSLFGMMNMLGVFGAMGSQYFVGAYTDWAKGQKLSGRAQWDGLFGVYMLVLLAGAVAWALYRTRPVEPIEKPLPE
jgi:sugar phosphate permease